MKKFVNFLAPKNIATQLMMLLFIVLVLAQIVNLLIIVGEKRILAQANLFDQASERTIEILQKAVNQPFDRLPYRIRGRQDHRGVFLLSKKNMALNIANLKNSADLAHTFKKSLDQRNIQYLSVSIAINTDKPISRNREFVKLSPNKKDHRQKKHREGKPKPDQFHQDRPKPPRGQPYPRQAHPDPPNGLAIQEFIISVEIKPNVWLNAILPHFSFEALTPRILIATIILLTITLLTAWFFIMRISKPLSQFTIAAERFGRGDSSLVLNETGPNDIRLAAQAFNTMQKRLSRMLETQKTMLRAVGHDLRTPLTSLRLRSELMPDPVEREKFIETIDDMTLMTEDILNWTKNISGVEEVQAVELNALISSVANDFSDQGENVVMENFEPTIIHIRRVAIKRALTNIISNALKYGKRAHISVENQIDYIDIHIDDEGPGIAEDLIEEALKPFVRLEKSRNKKTGGTGLGLSIAKTIVETDGGKLILSNIIKNEHTNGLRVTICLPKNNLT